MLSGAVVDDGRSESYHDHARRVTEHLKGVQGVVKVQNVKSSVIATTTEAVDRFCPRIFVEYVQEHGEYKGRMVKKSWAAENVRVYPPEKRKK